MRNRPSVLLFAAIVSINLLLNETGESVAQQYLPDARIQKDLISQGKPNRSRTVLPRLETPLSDAYLNRDNLSALPPDTRRQLGRYLVNSTVQVVIVLKDKKNANGIKKFLNAGRRKIIAEYENRIEVEVPIAALKALSERTEVLYIRRPLPVIEIDSTFSGATPEASLLAATGNYVTQGVTASNADSWHAQNFTGTGVQIAILDYFQYWDTAQLIGELPPAINTVGTLGLFSPHGTAVAEIIHDMAPDAALTFATPFSATQMAGLILDLAQSGNNIISSSLAFFNDEPGDGSGTVSSAIDTARDTYGALYCQAAGNHAQVHWDGYFSDLDNDGFNDFAGGSQEVNQLGYLHSGSLIVLNLRWNDWPVSDQDYDLHLVYWNGSSWTFAASSANIQDGTQPPTESIFLSAPLDGYYGLAVENVNATGEQVLDIMGNTYPLQFNQKSRSLVDPATADKSFSVAAVDATTFDLESYSSHGPTHGPGGILEGGLDKPRIAGFANVDTWSYGAGVFNGTSSATPHVAGAAALVFSALPSYSPEQVAQFLETSAIDQGLSGYDYLYGAGRLHLGNPPHSVSIVSSGSGTGTVASSPVGIACGTDCTANFPTGNMVSLTATGTSGSRASWDDCVSQGGTVSGNNTPAATCTFASLDENKVLSATFSSFPWILFHPTLSRP